MLTHTDQLVHAFIFILLILFENVIQQAFNMNMYSYSVDTFKIFIFMVAYNILRVSLSVLKILSISKDK